MVIHGANCRCRMVPETVILIGGNTYIRWIRECQRDPGFWTADRVELEKRLKRAIDDETAPA